MVLATAPYVEEQMDAEDVKHGTVTPGGGRGCGREQLFLLVFICTI